ncbi:MAG: hypothetical protein ACQEQL_05415 [Pseudomonadota bacterium]
MDSLNSAFTKARSDFNDWFSGSRVVDANGQPLVLFHGTVQDFDPADFRPLSHFGSASAANFVAEMDGDPGGRLFPVFLRMHNPLEIPDIYEHNRPQFANLFSKRRRQNILEWKFRKIFAPDEWQHCFDIDTHKDKEDWKARMIHILEAKGYDGFVYKNDYEDQGSLSYISFRSEQIRPALSEPETYTKATQYISKARHVRIRPDTLKP